MEAVGTDGILTSVFKKGVEVIAGQKDESDQVRPGHGPPEGE
jgi:hypothetical protein